MAKAEIIALIDRFISGVDISLAAANRLEVLLDDAWPEDDFVQGTVEMLACYRPEGGEWIVDVRAVQQRLVETRRRLNAGSAIQ
jgi:hypothetical protein